MIGLVDLDSGGHILTNGDTTHTSAEGVFAASDLIDRRYRQAVTALNAQRWLGQPHCPALDSITRKGKISS